MEVIPMFLDEILKRKRKEVALAKEKQPLKELEKKLSALSDARDFEKFISCKESLTLIAEIKRRSPSKGMIRQNFNPAEIAKLYESSGASAISVLTDEHFFGGDSSYLKITKYACRLPILRKDFIIDDYQIFESKILGADAILIIVAILDNKRLDRLINLAKDLGLHTLVEVHNKAEIDMALKHHPKIVGVNNRDLKTFKTSLEVSKNLVPIVAETGATVVVESGIKSRSDVEKIKGLGASAILVGEALMLSKNIPSKISELIG